MVWTAKETLIIKSIARSITCPISGLFVCFTISSHLASLGIQNTFSDRYSSLSSESAYSSWAICCCLTSNASETYSKNIKPKATCFYSEESILPLNLSAASHSLSSYPNIVLDFFLVIFSASIFLQISIILYITKVFFFQEIFTFSQIKTILLHLNCKF